MTMHMSVWSNIRPTTRISALFSAIFCPSVRSTWIFIQVDILDTHLYNRQGPFRLRIWRLWLQDWLTEYCNAILETSQRNWDLRKTKCIVAILDLLTGGNVTFSCRKQPASTRASTALLRLWTTPIPCRNPWDICQNLTWCHRLVHPPWTLCGGAPSSGYRRCPSTPMDQGQRSLNSLLQPLPSTLYLPICQWNLPCSRTFFDWR